MNKKNNKKQTQKKNKRIQEQTTFDPKMHHRSPKGSGYGLKKNYVPAPGEASGRQLAHIFNKELKKTI
jgi:hypothetical protein